MVFSAGAEKGTFTVTFDSLLSENVALLSSGKNRVRLEKALCASDQHDVS